MGFFNFPHTRTYDTDLGWIIAELNRVKELLNQYLENAVITFADPITWNITEQYTALTMVVDSDGTAYLSKQPVPAGIDITNTNYWLPVFNYDDNINTLRSQIAYNAQNSATTGESLAAGSLVFWKGLIYNVLVDMPAGTAFIVDTNIKKYTVDEKIKDFSDSVEAETAAREAADAALDARLTAETTARENADTALETALSAETDAREAADEALDARITALKSGVFYNVRDYGIEPNSGDIYDDMYDFLHDVVGTNGGTVYFPAGKYTTSYTIVIPPNTTFLGDGDATEIYFDETDTTFGVALASGGSNITIRDMKVNIASSGQYTAIDSIPGSIGFSDVDFFSETQKKQHSFERAACENLKAINVSTDTYYLIQTEPGTYPIKHVLYQNLRAPVGMVSIMPKSNNVISDVVMRGILCDCLRLGSYQATDIDSLQVSDINCTHLRIRLNNAQLNNIFIDNTRTCYCTTDLDTAITIYTGNAYINNLRGVTDGSQKTYFIYQPNNPANGPLYLNNAHCSGYNRPLYYLNNKIYVSNCNLNEIPTSVYSNVGITFATGYSAISGYQVLANPYIYNNFFIWYAVLSKGSGNVIGTFANWSRVGKRITGTGQAFNNAGTKCVPVIIDLDAHGSATVTALGGVDISDCQRLSINVLSPITTN